MLAERTAKPSPRAGSSNLDGISGRVGLEPSQPRLIIEKRIAIQAMDGPLFPDDMIGMGMVVWRARADAFELGDADSDLPKPLVVAEFDVIAGHRSLLSCRFQRLARPE